jgi:hypothetical protein
MLPMQTAAAATIVIHGNRVAREQFMAIHPG